MTNLSDRLPSGHSRRHAFTLVEMLVVIVIIGILAGLLFPAIHKIRIAGYTTDTEQELSQLSTAINEYYSIFHAYPGPFSNDQLEVEMTAGSGIPVGVPSTLSGSPTGAFFETYNANNTPQYSAATPTQWTVTGTENLVLGLLGGLRLDGTGTPPTYNPAFAPSEVGLGPLSLNPANPRRYSPFVDTRYLMWCSVNGPQVTQSNQMPTTPTQFTDLADHVGNDTPIPEFVDRFPNPMPILYLRARTGARGVVSDGIVNDPTTGNLATYQYDLRDIYGYLNGPNGPISLGLPQNTFHNLAFLQPPAGTLPPPAPCFIPTSGSTPPWPPPAAMPAGISSQAAYPHYDAFSYFANFGYIPTNESSALYTNYTARPRTVDQFILISAGADGIYGTQDDITSFGNVAQ